MRLLIDSDIFCKLGVSDLLDDAIAILGSSLDDCGRLPALPHMLQRGRLLTVYGLGPCARLLPVAEGIPAIATPGPEWLEKTAQVPSIDPGEAQLLALAAQCSLLVMTGDKRALSALKEIAGFPTALAGRIVVFEAILLALCSRLGTSVVRRKLAALPSSDKTVRICFSADNPDPPAALLSYFQNLAAEVHPLILWDPQPGGAP